MCDYVLYMVSVCVCVCLFVYVCVCLFVCVFDGFVYTFLPGQSLNAFLNVMQYLEVQWPLILKSISNIFNIVFTLEFGIVHIHSGRKKAVMLY